MTCVIPGSVFATAKEAAEALANRLNLHYPPEDRLAIARERDLSSGEYFIEGYRELGFLAGESPLHISASR